MKSKIKIKASIIFCVCLCVGFVFSGCKKPGEKQEKIPHVTNKQKSVTQANEFDKSTKEKVDVATSLFAQALAGNVDSQQSQMMSRDLITR